MTTSPTHARYRVVALATASAMITYLDRACIATLAPGIMRDLGLTTVQMGYVFTVFQLAYALFEIPTAWWADRKGTRPCCRASCCGGRASRRRPAPRSAIRSCSPSGSCSASARPARGRASPARSPAGFRARERGRVQGIFFAGAHLVGGLTPALVLWLLQFLSWREIFVCFGAVGFVWVAVWHAWFRNDPSEHPAVNAAELQTICRTVRPTAATRRGSNTGARSSRNRNMVALCVMYIPNCMIFYFCITWLPTYLRQRHGFDATSLGIFAGLPLIVSMPGDLLGGLVTDRLASRYGLRVGRCGLGAVAYVIAGVALLAAAASSTPVLAAGLIAVATGHDDVHARRRVGNRHRGRTQPRRRRRRDDELGRQPGRDAQPAHRRVLGAVVRQLEPAAVPDGRAVPGGRVLLDHGPSGGTSVCRSAAVSSRARNVSRQGIASQKLKVRS